jgi:F-type H+-transporting ATPase subunit b
MQIDWTTFVLEVINFLALVWILKRFLYRPVLDVLARRRAAVDRDLATAQAGKAQAAELQGQFEQRLADWEKEKAALRAALDTELAGERARQLHTLQTRLADEQARQAAQETHRQSDLRHELENQAIANATRFATALLTRTADAALEARLLDLLLDDLARLPPEQTDGLRATVATTAVQGSVVSAFPLADPQRTRLTEALAKVLKRPMELVFAEDATLVAGLRVTVGAWQLKANLADELAFFANGANHGD